MSQVTSLTIINNTPYHWEKTYVDHMNSISQHFPKQLEKGENLIIYIECEDTLDTIAEHVTQVIYTSEDFVHSQICFQINAQNQQLHILVDTSHLKHLNAKKPVLSCKLHLSANQSIQYMITGNQEGYLLTGEDSSHWIEEALPNIGQQKIGQLYMLAPQHQLSDVTSMKMPYDILQQLQEGVRYFDLMPVLGDKQFFVAPYKSGTSFEPEHCPTQKIEDFIHDINAFTNTHHELVILNFSHGMHLNASQKIPTKLTVSQWQNFMNLLKALSTIYIGTSNENLLNRTLNDLLKNGRRACVLIIIEDLYDLPEPYWGNGFFTYDQYNVRHSSQLLH